MGTAHSCCSLPGWGVSRGREECCEGLEKQVLAAPRGEGACVGLGGECCAVLSCPQSIAFQTPPQRGAALPVVAFLPDALSLWVDVAPLLTRVLPLYSPVVAFFITVPSYRASLPTLPSTVVSGLANVSGMREYVNQVKEGSH